MAFGRLLLDHKVEAVPMPPPSKMATVPSTRFATNIPSPFVVVNRE